MNETLLWMMMIFLTSAISATFAIMVTYVATRRSQVTAA
jgi:hypothetical protein